MQAKHTHTPLHTLLHRRTKRQYHSVSHSSIPYICVYMQATHTHTAIHTHTETVSVASLIYVNICRHHDTPPDQSPYTLSHTTTHTSKEQAYIGILNHTHNTTYTRVAVRVHLRVDSEAPLRWFWPNLRSGSVSEESPRCRAFQSGGKADKRLL